jgi:hypothetical protein
VCKFAMCVRMCVSCRCTYVGMSVHPTVPASMCMHACVCMHVPEHGVSAFIIIPDRSMAQLSRFACKLNCHNDCINVVLLPHKGNDFTMASSLLILLSSSHCSFCYVLSVFILQESNVHPRSLSPSRLTNGARLLSCVAGELGG